MYTIEQEICIGLAYLHARDRKRMPDKRAYEWAKEHWMEFLPQMDTDTGRVLLEMARQHPARRQEGRRQEEST
jgi:hypothetical protein